MKVDALRPMPSHHEPFRRDCLRFVPAASGCYVLTTMDGVILYVGLTVNLRARMEQHLDTPAKRAVTPLGLARCFHWLETNNLQPVERGWLNSHQALEGVWPILNKMASPL